MKDFEEFQNFCAKHYASLAFEIGSKMKDVSEDQRTISKEEWLFIERFAIESSMVLLRWYHEYYHGKNSSELPE